MHGTVRICHVLPLSLLVVFPAVGATVYQTTGTEAAQYAINTSEAIAMSWTSTAAFNNVSIVVSLATADLVALFTALIDIRRPQESIAADRNNSPMLSPLS